MRFMSLFAWDCRAEIATGNFRGALKPMPQATKIALLSILNLSALGLTTTWASPARAIIIDPGLISFSIDCNCSNPGYEGTVGWDFQVNNPHTIDALGVYDADGDGLEVATEVGLWNRDTGVLLASTTVQQGTAGYLLGKFRYSSIGSIALQTGVNYALGAQYSQPYNSDWYQLTTNNNSFASWLTYLNPTEVSGSSLTLPSNEQQSPFGIYGPNIASSVSGPSSVPGPLPIFGVAAAFGFSRKLRKRINKANNYVSSTYNL